MEIPMSNDLSFVAPKVKKEEKHKVKILTLGSVMQDVFLEYNNPEDLHIPQEKLSYICMQAGRKIEIKNMMYYCGGGAANSAVSFARLGYDVTIFCKVGSDQAADFIIKTLTSEHVATNHILTTTLEQSGNSFVIPGPQGNSAVLVYRGANATITEQELPESLIAQSDQLYITSLSGDTARLLIPITQLAKKYNTSVAVNPGTNQLRTNADYLKSALKNIDILILNSYEAELLMVSLIGKLPSADTQELKDKTLPELLQSSAPLNIKRFFTAVHEYGPATIVVTNGAEGVYASDTTTIYFHPSIPVDIVSSIGAGDAFGSCFVAQLHNNESIDDALRAGVINSASVIQQQATQPGLLTIQEVEKRRNALDKSLLKKYNL